MTLRSRSERLLAPFAGLLSRHGPNGVARRNAAGALRTIRLVAEDRRLAEAAVAAVASRDEYRPVRHV